MLFAVKVRLATFGLTLRDGKTRVIELPARKPNG